MSKFTKFCPKFTKVRMRWNLCSEVLLNQRTKYGWPKSFLSRKQLFLCLLLCPWTATQLQNSQTHCSEQLDSVVVCVQSELHRYVFTSTCILQTQYFCSEVFGLVSFVSKTVLFAWRCQFQHQRTVLSGGLTVGWTHSWWGVSTIECTGSHNPE